MAQLIDPHQLAGISDLELLARTVVDGLMSGIHRSPRTGSSAEFAQYRPYVQGDDPRFVDWKLYGRSDRLYLRQFREETNLHATLLLDCSASMGYGRGPLDKFRYAVALCACLATILQHQGDAVGLIAYHQELVQHLPPTLEGRQLRRLLATLAGLKPQRAGDVPRALGYLADVVAPRGLIVLVTDLLYPLDQVIDHLGLLRARRHDLLVFQIVDPSERDFDFADPLTLRDLEDAHEQYLVPDEIRAEYLANRQAHFQAVQRAALAAEIDLCELVCDQPLDHALRHFLHHRNRALKTSGLRATSGRRSWA